MKVSNTLQTYPDEGRRIYEPTEVQVESHSIHDDRVILRIPTNSAQPEECVCCVLIAEDLKRAVANATNHKQ